MNDFKPFGALVRSNADQMFASDEVYAANVDVNAMWEHYLSVFPEGTNPTFRERTEHDCSCCKHFVRSVGHLLTIKNGAIVTIWDNAQDNEDIYPYNVVAAAMRDYVLSAGIKNLYRTGEPTYGANETVDGTNSAIVWNHFNARVPNKFVSKDAGPLLSRMTSAYQVMKRGLEELRPSAIDDVIDLIVDKAIYRGEEHLRSVKEFRDIQREYSLLNSDESREIFLWENIKNPVATFRNTVIGTLIQDLSEGVAIDVAVGKFESKVAPQNYKRSSALITKRMIDNAVKTLEELGLSSAVKRRYARIEDISVNNVLFVDNDVRPSMKDGLTELLMEEATTPTKNYDKATPITMDNFMKDVLPNTTSLEVVLANSQLSNMVSLTAPQDEDSGNLFKWDNDFAWSYDGDVADSIAQRVKNAGGRVDNAKMRFSLAWTNTDDLDIHVGLPDGRRVTYANKMGLLDVDMNASSVTRKPVENVSWMSNPPSGQYVVYVNNYYKRENEDVGFTLEVQSGKDVKQYHYELPVANKETISCLKVDVVKGKIFSIEVLNSNLSEFGTSQTKWGVKPLEPVRVSTLMMSPNYWDGQEIGNKHWFFMIDGCKNPEKTRGMFNEYLTSNLMEHRKVFEVLGSKTKCEYTDNQLSGVGFSSTRKDKVTVLADSRPYEITF